MAKNNIQDEKVQEARRLISINEDARQYFFEKANDTWLKWLWENGFFDVFKEKAEDQSRFSFTMPELRYLARMVEFKPAVVAEIILDTPISQETFNPEVIDQFLRICGRLPGEHLPKIIEKIKTENWPALMQTFNQWGMEYGKMFESLDNSGCHKEILELASVVLNIREDWKTKPKEAYSDPTPFCLDNLSYSRVFHYLSNINENYIEDAINLSLSVLKNLTINVEEDKENPVIFERKDAYPLYRVDVFTVSVATEYHDSGRNDVQEVVALIKTLTERALTQRCNENAKAVYERHFKSLPDSWLMWRIRLFVLSLCPLELMPYLEDALFRIFREEHYSDLIRGAEYRKTLMRAFPLMDKDNQSRYVNLAKELFSYGKKEDTSSSLKQDGSRIFSVIAENLSKVQVTELVDSGFKIDPDYYVPTPIFQMGKGGFVSAKGPVTHEELQDIPVNKIVDNLKDTWSPTQLVEQDIQRDFLNPLNAKGMGDLIKNDVKNRLQEYLKYSIEFLDPKIIDMHYLYSLLSGITDAIDEKVETIDKADWDRLIALCLQIVKLGKTIPSEQLKHEERRNDTWLGRWNAVCNAMENLLEKILGSKDKNLGFEWQSHRADILSIIKFLFNYPDPVPKDEQIGSAKMTESIGFQDPVVIDPFTLAINSIRGQAFKLFVLAVELDTVEYGDSENARLSTDLKKLYESLLITEETRAIMFMFGHYLLFFYFKDKNWLKSNLDNIFPSDIEKKYLYLAAWEGYLTNNLYANIFKDEEFQSLYKRAIVMTEKEYPHQKHFTDPDEGVAQHLALAYLAIDFDSNNTLFDFFWANGNLTQHTAFVDKLGKAFITTKNTEATNFIKTNDKARRKLKDLWEWLLNNYPDPSVFDGIGFWINLDKGIFQAEELANYLKRTLELTDGYLQWNIGLKNTIIELAQEAPIETDEIVKLYLLEGGVRNKLNTFYFILQEEWEKVFDILYSTEVSKQATLSLINDLIKEGGSSFWPLKKVIEIG
jgi:hypothetical protein